MTPLRTFYTDAIFRLSTLSWIGVLDLLLVTMAFYLLLVLVRRSRAAFLLRGAILLGIVLFVITILLPLPTFDWLVQGLLVVMVVATPIIFQPELRRLLERVGRSAGGALAVRQTTAESMLASLVRAVERLTATSTGALIALEGRDSLQEVIETGVPINGQVTSELLQSLFYPENPLHDGAVILREDRLVAASCVLPLTQHPLHFRRRLGTRHRSAVGLSEVSDALVIVVSEETGHISVARDGTLQRPLDITGLREHLLGFYLPSDEETPASPPLRKLIKEAIQRVWQSPPRPDSRHLLSNLSLGLVAFLLALVTWGVVTEQTNPTQREQIDGIPLRIQDMPPDATTVEPPPDSVAVLVQTTAQAQPSLSSATFQATASLAGLPPGLHQVEIMVNESANQVRVLEVIPPVLDLEIAPVISQTFPVIVELLNQENLSAAYQIVGVPSVVPAEVTVTGPQPLVEQVSQVQTTLSLANATGSLREFRTVQAVDQTGREITGVELDPKQVQVSVSIRRRLNAVDVGVRTVITGTPAPGYWLSSVSVEPATITLQGDPEKLTEMGSFVDTLPVDVSGAAGNFSAETPLALSADIQPFDDQGNLARTVTVSARIIPRTGDLAVTRPVEMVHVKPNTTVTPAQVDLLLSGPLPALNEIESNPELVRVMVNTMDLGDNVSVEVEPTVITPEEIRVQVVPPSVLVNIP